MPNFHPSYLLFEMKVYRYKLYSNARRGELRELIYRFGILRNYAVKMYRGYYKLTGKTLSVYQLSNHIAKVKRNPVRRTAKMVEGLPSQAVQECIARIDKGYRNFFSYCKQRKSGKASTRVRPPSIRKPSKNLSFTLLQCGYRFSSTEPNKVRIGKKTYGFFQESGTERKGQASNSQEGLVWRFVDCRPYGLDGGQESAYDGSCRRV